VVGMDCIDESETDTTILVDSEKGNGKRSPLEEYRITNRGGKGVKTMNINEKTGPLIGIKGVNDEDHLVITNKSGLTIRMDISKIRVMGRATQGVRLISLNQNDAIADITVIKGGTEGDDDIEEALPMDEEE